MTGSIQSDLKGNNRKIAGSAADDITRKIFGFSSTCIIQPVERTLYELRSLDSLHSQISAKGTIAYHSLVGEIRREIDKQNGWSATRKDDYYNSPRAFNSERGIAIAFAQGNQAVGNVHNDNLLLKKRKLGITTARQCAYSIQYQAKLDIFNENKPAIRAFWFILYSFRGLKVGIELAKPSGISADGRVLGWDERIAFEDFSLAVPVRAINDDLVVTENDKVAISAK